MNKTVIIETITKVGTEWGVSLNGSNPTADEFLPCANQGQASRLAEIIDNYEIEIMRGIIKFVIGDSGLDCAHWGERPDGVIGGCGKCAACKIAEIMD